MYSREWGLNLVPCNLRPSPPPLPPDIEDSTVLWETIPAPAMDEALLLHHACLRAVAAKHKGYESATEGDSFVLAFFRSALNPEA